MSADECQFCGVIGDGEEGWLDDHLEICRRAPVPCPSRCVCALSACLCVRFDFSTIHLLVLGCRVDTCACVSVCLSVGRSVGRSVRPSVGRSVSLAVCSACAYRYVHTVLTSTFPSQGVRMSRNSTALDDRAASASVFSQRRLVYLFSSQTRGAVGQKLF